MLLPQELANKVTPSWTTRAWRAFSGVVEESTIFRKAIAPGYTSLYHAVSFGRELGYADARKLGLASEEHLDRASMVLAGGLGLALASVQESAQWSAQVSGMRHRCLRTCRTWQGICQRCSCLRTDHC